MTVLPQLLHGSTPKFSRYVNIFQVIPKLIVAKRVKRALEYEHGQYYSTIDGFPREWGENQAQYFDTAVRLLLFYL